MTTAPNRCDAPVVVKDLSKSFKKPVLDHVSLTVAEGEILTILGRSGTGKSVLLKLLIGITAPDGGSICLKGKEINGLATAELEEVRKKVGFLFQQAALYDSMTIADNIGFPIMRHTDIPATERGERVQQLLAQIGMENDGSKMPGEVSGGMKKRAGIARALALDPEILMLDEPTAGLDPITASEIVDLVMELRKKRKTTCLIVTHDFISARKLSDRLILLHEGKIRAEGTLDDLEASKDSFVRSFLKGAT